MLQGPATRCQIRNFVINNFVLEDDTVEDETPLLDDGLIDSAGVLELISFIEQTFDISIDDADVTLDHFSSITSLAAFVDSECLRTKSGTLA